MEPAQLLSDALVESIRERAARYDAENEFFHDDLADLRAAGYLTALAPTAVGGFGWSLTQTVDAQLRLAGAAPATALAVNMHQVWVAVARVLADRGDDSLDFVLSEAAAGEIFAFGISEPGNDLVLLGSRTRAEPDGEGGYTFHGTKIFTSLAPVWTRLGTFGLDDTSADAPKNVFGFVERDAGVQITGDWDTLGMRATQSHTTMLDGAHARADRVVRRLDPGPNPDSLIFAIFAAFSILISAVYAGIAQRALDLAVESVQQRGSLRHEGLPLSQIPEVRQGLAAAGIALDGALTQVRALARDVDEQVDHGGAWFAKLSGLKVRTTTVAQEVVLACLHTSGGGAYTRTSELSRLARDVLAGAFHPSSEDSAHQSMAAYLLGPLP